MKNDNSIKNTFSIFIIGLLALSLVSCGSSQNAYNNNDGIYATEQKKDIVIVKDTESNYYQDYFATESERYDLDEDDIFTDIDDYGYEDADTLYVDSEYSQGAPWNYSTEVSVSFHMGFGGYYGYYNPWHYGYGGYYPWYGYGGYYPWYGYGGGYWGYCPPYYPGYPGYHPPYYGNSSYGKRDTYSTNRYSRGRMNTSSISSREAYNYKRGYSSSNRRASTRNQSTYSNGTRATARNSGSNTRNIAGTAKNRTKYNQNSNSRKVASTYRSGSGDVRRSTGRQQQYINSGKRTGNYMANNSSQANRPVKIVRTNSSQRRVSYSIPSNSNKSSTYNRTQKNSSGNYSRTNSNQYNRAKPSSSNYNSSRSSYNRSSSSSGSRSSGASSSSSSSRSSSSGARSSSSSRSSRR